MSVRDMPIPIIVRSSYCRILIFSKNKEKMLQIEFDYNSMMRMLRRMKFDNEVLICQGDAIVLSNGPFSGVGKNLT